MTPMIMYKETLIECGLWRVIGWVIGFKTYDPTYDFCGYAYPSWGFCGVNAFVGTIGVYPPNNTAA